MTELQQIHPTEIEITILEIIGKEHPKIPFKWKVKTDTEDYPVFLICWDEIYSENLFELNNKYTIPVSGKYNSQYNNYTLHSALHKQKKETPLKSWFKRTILTKISEVGHNYTPVEGEFRASQIPGCSRRQILNKSPDWVDLEIIPIELKPSDLADIDLTLGPNNSGQSIHEFIQNLVSDDEHIKIERYVEKEYSVELGDQIVTFKIVGHVDLEIPMFDGEIHTVDIKTFHEKCLECDYDTVSFLPNKSHLQQLSIYQDITEQHGDLLYLSRNDLRPLFFSQSREEGSNLFVDVLKKVAKLRYCEMNKILPNALDLDWDKKNNRSKLNYQCNDCEFREYCFTDGVEN